MTHDDPEGLAELARRRYGMDLSEPHEWDDVADEPTPEAGAEPRLKRPRPSSRLRPS